MLNNRMKSLLQANCFISHVKNENWGSSIMIMEKHGKAFGRIYWYTDDNTTVYLEGLSVEEMERRKGIGTDLLKVFEEIGIFLGATTSCLWVKKDTWIYSWYKRCGYKDSIDYEGEENAIWMQKSLVLNNEENFTDKDIKDFCDNAIEGYNKVIPKHLRDNTNIDKSKEKAFELWIKKLRQKLDWNTI